MEILISFNHYIIPLFNLLLHISSFLFSSFTTEFKLVLRLLRP